MVLNENVKGGAQAHQLWTHDQKAYVEQERKKKEEKANLEKNLGKILYFTRFFREIDNGFFFRLWYIEDADERIAMRKKRLKELQKRNEALARKQNNSANSELRSEYMENQQKKPSPVTSKKNIQDVSENTDSGCNCSIQ